MILIINFVIFLGQNRSTFVSPRMTSSPMKNITFRIHLQRLRKLALMTWMTVISHGYRSSMENERAWVSAVELGSTFVSVLLHHFTAVYGAGITCSAQHFTSVYGAGIRCNAWHSMLRGSAPVQIKRLLNFRIAPLFC
jgi:hypothetical protein